MQAEDRRNISDFWIAGINYRKTDATIRGQFAINNEQYASILSLAPAHGIKEMFLLSTCNRTEIYGFAADINQLITLLCTQTTGDKETFLDLAYIKRGVAAVDHLFQVSAGLDSQVLGDYEIVGQMKVAAKFAKEAGYMSAFTERLVNCALQSSKAIKNSTKLSGGTVSVSFAAIQYIREHVPAYKQKKILLLGTGKIGRNTCKNLVDYLGTSNITLINRTASKAEALAVAHGLRFAPVEQTEQYIRESDIIITATSASAPIVLKSHLEHSGSKILIDLSVPYNIEATAATLENVQLLNVDTLSRMKDETLQCREAEVPKAKDIITEHIGEFMDWYDMRIHVPLLVALKTKLDQIEHCPLARDIVDEIAAAAPKQRIRKVMSSTALKLKTHNNRGCYYIEAINDFIAI